MARVLMLNGTARGDRAEVKDAISELIKQCGWLLGGTELKRGGIAIAFEIDPGNLEWLSTMLADTGLQLDDESCGLLAERVAGLSAEDADRSNLRSTLEINFS